MEKKSPEKYAKLNTGAFIPRAGLGTWKSAPGEVGAAITAAIKAGVRHIDCAAVYENEAEIGKALQAIFAQGVIKREDLFITSKLWNTNHGKDEVPLALKKTLADLQLQYVDLYLMHFPFAFEHQGIPPKSVLPKDDKGNLLFAKVTVQETWQAMEKLVPAGLTKAIGVSNFNIQQINDVLAYAKIVPVVNQIEFHPHYQRTTLLAHCQRFGIHVTAYSPFGTELAGKSGPLFDPVIVKLAEKHKRSSAQIVLRWLIQLGLSVIPKSVKPEHIKENANIFDFQLSEDEVKGVGAANKGKVYCSPTHYWGFAAFE